jgi:dimethylhistidine N-methyltransferase
MNTSRLKLAAARPDADLAAFAREVERGLSSTPKRLACRFFYDRVGSELFEEICALPEYYLTRAEDEILRDHAAEIVGALPRRSALVELGSGSAHKTRRLIEACLAREGALVYVPIDISRTMLEQSARTLVDAYPGLSVRALATEYEDGLRTLKQDRVEPKLVLWLGSNVGNFDRASAVRFLTRLASWMGERDRLLIGIDLRKDASVIELAYDDPAGVTARFNLNLLARIDRELGADFQSAQFRHVASYDAREGRVQMFLESAVDQSVWIESLARSVRFTAGERIHTEDSYKYSPAEIEGLARASGMYVERTWFDSRAQFSSSLFAPLR